MKKRVLFLCASCMLLAAGVFCVVFFSHLKPADSALSSESVVGTPYQLEVASGNTLHGIAKKLKSAGIIRSERAFLLYARLKKYSAKRGLYTISPEMPSRQILKIIDSGVSDPIVVSIPEGYTIKKIARLLEENKICRAADFIGAAARGEGAPFSSYEGFLFPDTYFFDYGMDAKTVIQKMIDNFYEKIDVIDGLQNLTDAQLYEKVKLASIVEREYRLAKEAPLIASVFSNRIERGMALESCATVEYIITEIEDLPHPKVIMYKDLERKNPYNSYIYKGLPPSPICNPGLTALKAAAQPEKSNYFFFRVIDAQKGEHYFSKDFSEHREVGQVYYTKNAS
ncbi:MAG: endolytic transglycosylase MltG [Treponemataceae bacterium]|nr:MAG: endolytic transglycosylase MltG [Treponemataceae bacterium]